MNEYCEHSVYADGHCAEMACRNYINKCPVHRLVLPEQGGSCSHLTTARPVLVKVPLEVLDVLEEWLAENEPSGVEVRSEDVARSEWYGIVKKFYEDARSV